MSDTVIYKIGLLLLNNDATKFLVVRRKDVTQQWLLPGGRIEEGESHQETLAREIQEELGCVVDCAGMIYVGDYEAPAAGRPGRVVHITLYRASISGDATPTSEIKELGWLSREDEGNTEASILISGQLIPDLVKRGILQKEKAPDRDGTL